MLRRAKHHAPVFFYVPKAANWFLEFLKNKTKTFSIL